LSTRTLPAAWPQVEYEITAVRSTRRGVPARFQVRIGADASTAQRYGQRLAA
jgi:hypothetical protein